jgi:hypothetical protein
VAPLIGGALGGGIYSMLFGVQGKAKPVVEPVPARVTA